MNWKIGDRALLVDNGSVKGAENLQVMGETCVIIAVNLDDWDWDVDVCGEVFYVDATCLRRIPDHYDGLEVTTWDESPFKPKELVTI